jgi:hypothetical protein
MPQRETSTAATLDPELEAFTREHFDNAAFLRTDAGARQVLLALAQGSDEEAEKPPPIAALKLPDIPQLQHCAARIEHADEVELRWAARNPGVAYMRHSSGEFGRQLQHAESFGYGALPCRRCGGKWRSKRMAKGAQCTECRASLPTGATECPACHAMFGSGWQDGSGQSPKPRLGKGGKRMTYTMLLAEYRVKMQQQLGIVLMSRPMPKPESGIVADVAWQMISDKFKADGKTLMTDAEFRALFPRVPEEECEPCTECGGIGVVPRRGARHDSEITAFPTGNSKQIGGREAQSVEKLNAQLARGMAVVDGDACVVLGELERWVTVQNILADVGRVAFIARVALDEYYSDDNGMDRLVEMCPGATDGVRARAAGELRDFMSKCFNLCAYGAESP